MGSKALDIVSSVVLYSVVTQGIVSVVVVSSFTIQNVALRFLALFISFKHFVDLLMKSTNPSVLCRSFLHLPSASWQESTRNPLSDRLVGSLLLSRSISIRDKAD